MARADLLVKLIKAGSHGDTTAFRRTAEAVIADERAKNHTILADRLSENLMLNGNGRRLSGSLDRAAEFVFESNPSKTFDALILPSTVRKACQELVEEQHKADVLRSHGLEPRHRMLLSGPPWNGKTSLTMAIANALMLPLYTVRYEGLIGSFLGETAGRLKRLNFAQHISQNLARGLLCRDRRVWNHRVAQASP